ncbi:PREDICTED: uncharacterized protein LOC109180278 [Ipomoea nil]|uniref:uncharacterized protein LOC109180278 n=1 Tax=Ipomoea nil TaxID=35883 RepID=UPI000901DBFB|nr:PREDICTED: uncharacterized protein LOC109180278 [Ipomoea nil]XP_019185314.1 PREDICTED: uncharacterized protein LOC109180278 [Ipomoea nil]
MVVESLSPPVAPRHQKEGARREVFSRNNAIGNQRRRRAADGGDNDDDPAGDRRIKCTGKSCKACTAGVIADCVAVCCCPCAVVDCLVLALFKVPWKVGRRCLRMRKKKKRGGGAGGRRQLDNKDNGSDDGISRMGMVEEGALEIALSEFGNNGEDELKDSFSARFDAEEVWLELYQVGHLGFGRVPPQGDGN